MNNIPQTCSTTEAAKRLKVTVSTIHNWVEAGHLSAWKTPGGHRKITLDSLDRLINSGLPQSEADSIKRFSLVVVEDEADLRDIYRGHIERWEIPVQLHIANDGYEGLVMAGLYKPDLLITDLMMPCVDGLSMIKAMRACKETASIPVVIVSGMHGEDIPHKELPPDIRILGKPIPFDQLRRIVEELIQTRSKS